MTRLTKLYGIGSSWWIRSIIWYLGLALNKTQYGCIAEELTTTSAEVKAYDFSNNAPTWSEKTVKKSCGQNDLEVRRDKFG